MAATVQYAGELKRLAGGSMAGRKLAKPVMHYTLSWGQDERSNRQEMRRAVDCHGGAGVEPQELVPLMMHLKADRRKCQVGSECLALVPLAGSR